MAQIPADRHLHIGAIIYASMDQIDFTGPFEVLSRLPNSTFHILGKRRIAIRDARGLLLTPEQTLSEAPQLDLLLVPGGYGQEDLMDDEEVLSFIRSHVERGGYLLAVCTGVLLCGAAGVMNGIKATTHWRVLDLLPYFGAVVVNQRVVEHGRIVTAGGVTAGIDGALRIAAMLRGDQAAQEIQLYMQYAPEPPFDSGTPDRAPADVLDSVKAATSPITARRFAVRNAIRSAG
jgi:cyclohexyl-isocyanide hydratase